MTPHVVDGHRARSAQLEPGVASVWAAHSATSWSRTGARLRSSSRWAKLPVKGRAGGHIEPHRRPAGPLPQLTMHGARLAIHRRGWLVDGVELDPVQGGVVGDGPGVRGSPAEGFEVCFPGAADIVLIDRGEGNQLDRVDLDPARSDSVTPPRRDLPALPQPERDSDLARQDILAQLFAELHLADSTSQLCGLLPDHTAPPARAGPNAAA